MMGGSDRDVEAVKNAGCRTGQLLVNQPSGRKSKDFDSRRIGVDILAPPLLGAIPQIRDPSTPEKGTSE